MKSTITLLVLALAAPAAYAAEDIYRSVMPDGRILYGESPTPGAKSVTKMPSAPASTGVTVVTPEEKARNLSTPAGGGVAVLPQVPRPPTTPATAGELQSPSGLPKRAY
jgi:hypothetical protein